MENKLKELNKSWYTKAHYDLKISKEFPNPYIEKHSEMVSGYINGVLDFRENVLKMIKNELKGTFVINNQSELLDLLNQKIENLQYEK